jgi:hypothetical protein
MAMSTPDYDFAVKHLRLNTFLWGSHKYVSSKHPIVTANSIFF